MNIVNFPREVLRLQLRYSKGSEGKKGECDEHEGVGKPHRGVLRRLRRNARTLSLEKRRIYGESYTVNEEFKLTCEKQEMDCDDLSVVGTGNCSKTGKNGFWCRKVSITQMKEKGKCFFKL